MGIRGAIVGGTIHKFAQWSSSGSAAFLPKEKNQRLHIMTENIQRLTLRTFDDGTRLFAAGQA